ncbi:MAG: JAB domain-containing protein [Myxococcota bacterium]
MREAQALAVLFDRPQRTPELLELLHAFGGWSGVFHAGPEPLVAALGLDRRPAIEALFELLEAWQSERLSAAIQGPEDLLDRLRPWLGLEPVEGFWVVCLDARGRVAGWERVSMGTLTACLVHPREVFAPALRRRAASVVVLHNHPSGDPRPSPEDVALTERLIDAGRLLGIPLVDHVVVARGGTHSLMDGVAA